MKCFMFQTWDILLAYHVREYSWWVTPDEATASHQGEAEDASGDAEEEGDDGEGDVRREGEVVIHPEKEQHWEEENHGSINLKILLSDVSYFKYPKYNAAYDAAATLTPRMMLRTVMKHRRQANIAGVMLTPHTILALFTFTARLSVLCFYSWSSLLNTVREWS